VRERGRRARLAPTVAALGQIELFDGAARVTLERLAGELVEVHVPAGAPVVTEGEVADALYVIRAGHFSVLSTKGSDDEPVKVNEMGSDDWFGEIGLVTGSARTATVIADVDSVVWKIPGGLFLDAISASVVLADPLDRGIRGRLLRTHPQRVAALATSEKG
jgi:CRP-like cAMP-binding protein